MDLIFKVKQLMELSQQMVNQQCLYMLMEHKVGYLQKIKQQEIMVLVILQQQVEQ
jgi:hypothetical protein